VFDPSMGSPIDEEALRNELVVWGLNAECFPGFGTKNMQISVRLASDPFVNETLHTFMSLQGRQRPLVSQGQEVDD
jgi:hypothetical protein